MNPESTRGEGSIAPALLERDADVAPLEFANGLLESLLAADVFIDKRIEMNAHDWSPEKRARTPLTATEHQNSNTRLSYGIPERGDWMLTPSRVSSRRLA